MCVNLIFGGLSNTMYEYCVLNVHLKEEEKRMRDEQIAFRQQQLDRQTHMKDKLNKLEGTTKKRLSKDDRGEV